MLGQGSGKDVSGGQKAGVDKLLTIFSRQIDPSVRAVALILSTSRLAVLLVAPLLALAAILLLLVRLPPWRYAPVQSLHIFSNLPLFAALYYLWLLLLFILLWRLHSPWQGAVVVGLFVLVYVGTVVLATSYGAGEDWVRAADPVQIQETGKLDFEGYRDFPALAILGSSLSFATNVDIMTLRTSLLLIWLVILSQLLLVGYSRLFKSLPLAALAVLLALQSNLVLARFYLHPSHMGVMLVVALLGFLLGREQPVSSRERLVLILFMAGLTMTHFVSSLVGLLIIAGYWLEQRWRRRPEVVNQATVALGLTLVASWAMYWTIQTFPSLVRLIPEVGDRFQEGRAFFWISRVTRANTEGIPAWVTAVRTFWWVAVYLGGGVVALRSLLLRHRLAPQPNGYPAAYFVLAGSIVIGTVVSTGGYDFYRLIVYGSFLAAPLVVHFLLAGRAGRIRRLAVSGVFLALSFPSLLAHNTAIGLQATHPSEVAAARFVSRGAEGPEGVPRLYGGYRGPDIVGYYKTAFIPNTVYFPKQGVDVVDIAEGRALWSRHINNFLKEAEQGRGALFIFDYQDVVFWRHLFRLSEDDPMWGEVRQGLSQAGLIYDGGRVQIYRSEAPSQ
jgi:hypothetical protein